jgi:hypothetical protein
MRPARSLGILGGPSAIGTAGDLGPLGSQDEDIDAISVYMARTPAKTDAARKKQDEYKVWLDGVSWYDKRFDRPTYDHARNLHTEFNVANAVTDTEKQAVQYVIQHGLTTEEMQGQPRRMTSGGTYSEKDSGVGAPSLPTWAKWLIGFGIGIGSLYALGQITTLASIFAGKRYSKPAHTANPKRRRRAHR